MIKVTNRSQRLSSISVAGKHSDGLWTFFILTYALTFLTWGVLAIFQMRVATATETNAAP